MSRDTEARRHGTEVVRPLAGPQIVGAACSKTRNRIKSPRRLKLNCGPKRVADRQPQKRSTLSILVNHGKRRPSSETWLSSIDPL